MKLCFQHIQTIIITSLAIFLALFLVANGCEKHERVAAIRTNGVTKLSYTSCYVTGYVLDLGDAGINQHGFVWSLGESPTLNNLKINLGSKETVGTFGYTLTGLAAGTKYYFRSFALSGDEEYYGKQVSFTTLAFQLPVVTTSNPDSISTTTAKVGGNVTDDGDDAVTERGVYYTTTAGAETTGTKLIIGSGMGEFYTSLTGLTAGTKYYVKAYATNSAGTAYGSGVSFAIETEIVVPTLTTAAVTAVTETTAQSGGDISDDGGASVAERGVCWSTNQNPTTADNKTSDGTGGTGSFTSSIGGLTSNTTYYVRAYAINSAGTGYGQEVEFTTDAVTDYDGNTYGTVTIGDQTWMSENLKVTHYPDGSAIPLVTDNTAWGNLGNNNTDDAYCYYNNNKNNESTIYGALYTWSAAMGDNAISSVNNPSGVQGVCPNGWHLPSKEEWIQLIDFLGGDSIAGAKLKETGTTHWVAPNVGATNVTGFTALPGGRRQATDGSFINKGALCHFWSATEDGDSNAWYIDIPINSEEINSYNYFKSIGMSVRCIKD